MSKIYLSVVLSAMACLGAQASITDYMQGAGFNSRFLTTCNQSGLYKMGSNKSNPLRLPETWDDQVIDAEGVNHRYAMSVDIFLSGIGATHVGGFGADVIYSEDGKKAYSTAFTLNYYQDAYAVGDVQEDGSVVFPSGQYVYDTPTGESAYFYAAYLGEGEDWPVLKDELKLVKDDNGNLKTEPGWYFMVLTDNNISEQTGEETEFICFGTDYVFQPLPENLVEAQMPADAEVKELQYVRNELDAGGAQIVSTVKVGFSGDKVYISGVSDYVPESVLVGTFIDDTTIEVKSHQYIGYYDEGNFPYLYEFTMAHPFYFDNDEQTVAYLPAESVTMTINEERDRITIADESAIFCNSYGEMSNWQDVSWNNMWGDFSGPAVPSAASDTQFYGDNPPYIFFEWSGTSVDGRPLDHNNLYCELYINGDLYTFKTADYEGLEKDMVRVPYDFKDSGYDLITGTSTTLYLNEYEGRRAEIKSIGVRTVYVSGQEEYSSEIVYADGYEPFEDVPAVPAAASKVVALQDYYDIFLFDYDCTDVNGNAINPKLLQAEILIDGEPLKFSNDDYYFSNSSAQEVTAFGLSEYAPDYSSSLLSHYGDNYQVSLWGHTDRLPEFNTLGVRIVCLGGGEINYSDVKTLDLRRDATPATPGSVIYDPDTRKLTFQALPVDESGEGLSWRHYGYEVYVDGKLYTFPAEMYGLDENITYVPYAGFEYNYNFYFHTVYDMDEDYNVVGQSYVGEISMLDENLDFNVIGVRAVYTDGEGVKHYSDIINSDGTVGVDVVSADVTDIRWFNLQGVEVSSPERGSVYLQMHNGRTRKVLVK